MTDGRVSRRLAAILAADVSGYSRLMGEDEVGTLARLKAHRIKRFEPIVSRHGGRIFKLTGDGILAEFGSAVDALDAAVTFQQAVEDANYDVPSTHAIRFRIGLHIGDVIIEGDDLYGDGVNVAARLEAAAQPGGIIISRSVHDATAGRLNAAFDALGDLALKNIARPVGAFSVSWQATDWRSTTSSVPPIEAPPSLPDKPSIAVLPFQNMSGDQDQEYFVDGLVEDIITALSRNQSLFVIARNSSFSYKGTSPDIRRVGRELGVRYVLEGSIRKAGDRLRITAQLVDAHSGGHLWAERFDGSVSDVFDLQDQVASQVVAVIAPAVEKAETDRSLRKATESLHAYDYCLRGLLRFRKFTREQNYEAFDLFMKAAELDAGYGRALGHAVACLTQRKAWGWFADAPTEIAAAERLSRKALDIDRDDPLVLAKAGYALFYVVGDDNGVALIDRALELDPNLAEAWAVGGLAKMFLGDGDAIRHFERGLRLNPRDARIWALYNGMAQAHFLAGYYADATSWAHKALQELPGYPPSLRVSIAALAMDGRLEEARRALQNYLAIDPNVRIAHLRPVMIFRRNTDFEKYAEGFRLAGMAN